MPFKWTSFFGMKDKLPQRVQEALGGISSDAIEEVVRGFEQLASITKRTEDVAMHLDKLLAAGLVPLIISHLNDGIMQRFSQVADAEAGKEALHMAVIATLGELVWSRDCAPEVRPVVLQEGGMGALAELVKNTSSEGLRLRALVVCRRMLYEVGSTGCMETEAIKAASESKLVGVLMGLLSQVVDKDVPGVTVESLEGVTYLLQRMMVCLEPIQKELLQLGEHLKSAANVVVTHLREAANSGSDSPETQHAIRASLLAIRELAWDDHNNCIEPGMGAMAAAGAFEEVAGLMSSIQGVTEGAQGKTPEDVKGAMHHSPSPFAKGLLSVGTTDLACALLDKLAAVPESMLPEKLAAQVPRMMHSVIAALVAQLDGTYLPGEGAGGYDDVAARQERALSALRKLLVIENSKFVPPAAVEAADAEGVPACLRKLALNCAEFVGASASISATVGVSGGHPGTSTDATEGKEEEEQQVCCTFPTAIAAAALLADLTASSALAAAANGQPGQAAAELREVEAVVVPLLSHAETDQPACRNFCFALYQLSLVHYADLSAEDTENEDSVDVEINMSNPRAAESLTAPGAVAHAAARIPAPPEEEQYALSSELVTLMGRLADGINGLLAGGGCGEARLNPRSSRSTLGSKSTIMTHNRSQSCESVFDGGGAELGISVLSRLQRATQFIHEIVGLRPAMGSSPISRHNLDALFVHGTMQALMQLLDAYYSGLRVWVKARKEAKLAQDAHEKAEKAKAEAGAPKDGIGPIQPERPITAYLEKPPPSVLLPLLHHESGVLELMKELVRDIPNARIRLRDIGAIPIFARMLHENRRDNLLVSLQFNLARSEAIHPALKQAGCVALMESVLMEPPCGDGAQYDVRQLLSLCTLGLVAGEDVGSRFSQAYKQAGNKRGNHSVGSEEGETLRGGMKEGKNKQERETWALRAAGLLESFDMADLMKRVMQDACRDGKYIISSSTSAWPFMLEPAALTVQSLARSDAMARRLDENKIPEMLISALGNKHGRQPENALCIARALLNFARLPDLHPGLLAAGCVSALEPWAFNDDLCISDAAKGCLLYLGELPDAAARSALQGSTPEALAPVLQAPLPSSSTGPRLSGALANLTDNGGDEEFRRLDTFMSRRHAPLSRNSSSSKAAMAALNETSSADSVVDVLISYKRMDALTFAHMLHMALVLRGVGCLLDYEYKPDLSDVEQVVARCRTLVLILTDNVLNSSRCLQELEAAAKHSVHVLIVVKEGARWGDASGNMLTYPPSQTIRALKPSIQSVFALKAVHHRDEHYGYFVTQLMKRLKRYQPSLSSARHSRPPQMWHTTTGGSLSPAVKLDSTAGHEKPSLSHLGAESRKRASIAGLNPAAEGPSPKQAITGATQPPSQQSTPQQPHMPAGHIAALDGITAEVTALRQMVVLGAGQQQAIQALQADIALVRREVVAEVASSSRQLAASLAGEMNNWAQQVHGSVTSEAAAHANGLATLKAEIASALNVAAISVRTELGQEMGLNMRHLAADIAELRQNMSLLLDLANSSQQNLAITSMPSLQHMGLDSASTYPPSQVQTLHPTHSAELAQTLQPMQPLQPRPPSHSPNQGPISPPQLFQAQEASPTRGQASTAGLVNGSSGVLLPPIIGNGSVPSFDLSSPSQHQGRHTVPKATGALAGRDLPHALLGNAGGLSSVGSMTPNVGGFAGPRLLAAQQQQYQQQRAMQVHATAARNKTGGR